MRWPATLYGAWLVLRANQAWAPFPDNDPDAARALMARFYGLLRRGEGTRLDPVRAAALEVEWWRAHREAQHDASVGAGGARRRAGDALRARLRRRPRRRP